MQLCATLTYALQWNYSPLRALPLGTLVLRLISINITGTRDDYRETGECRPVIGEQRGCKSLNSEEGVIYVITGFRERDNDFPTTFGFCHEHCLGTSRNLIRIPFIAESEIHPCCKIPPTLQYPSTAPRSLVTSWCWGLCS